MSSRWRQPGLLVGTLVPAFLVCAVLLALPRYSMMGARIGSASAPGPLSESPATSGLPTPQSACVVQEDGEWACTVGYTS